MFTSRLKQLRKEAGLTQRNIADVFHTSPQSYAQWEKGLRSPSKESIEKLADFFKVSTDYLLGNSDIKKPTEKSEIELLIEQLSDEQKKETLQFIRNILQWLFPSSLWIEVFPLSSRQDLLDFPYIFTVFTTKKPLEPGSNALRILRQPTGLFFSSNC